MSKLPQLKSKLSDLHRKMLAERDLKKVSQLLTDYGKKIEEFHRTQADEKGLVVENGKLVQGRKGGHGTEKGPAGGAYLRKARVREYDRTVVGGLMGRSGNGR